MSTDPKSLPPSTKFVGTFDVRNAAKRGKEISCFQIDADGKISVGAKDQFRVFSSPQLPIDLNVGFDQFVPKKDQTAIDPILETIEKSNIDLKPVHFVSFRNNFNKIMETPYSRNEWSIDIEKKENTIFFHIVQKPDSTEPQQQKFSYYGYPLYVCTDTNNSKSVDPNVQFCSLVSLNMSEHKILLAAEIDCYRSSTKRKMEVPDATDGATTSSTTSQDGGAKTGDTLSRLLFLTSSRTDPPEKIISQSSYIELKTSKTIDSEKVNHTFLRYKLLKFWIQSHLAGVPNIFCGFRDDEGMVRSVRDIQVEDIPNQVRGKWNPAECVAFTYGLLTWLRGQVKEGRGYTLTFSEPYREPTGSCLGRAEATASKWTQHKFDRARSSMHSILKRQRSFKRVSFSEQLTTDAISLPNQYSFGQTRRRRTQTVTGEPMFSLYTDSQLKRYQSMCTWFIIACLIMAALSAGAELGISTTHTSRSLAILS
ncbi:putative Protein dom-3 [Planoprotostelium fungivorum]|uniref:Decapping nuclease n=1 Tax=Planoprotostelium fungivorum TaxID=1890364 RepID=A0A2P6NUM9_9EUKA|nr:putative Protein dom-3 [Planoprotostelium fungivorum]